MSNPNSEDAGTACCVFEVCLGVVSEVDQDRCVPNPGPIPTFVSVASPKIDAQARSECTVIVIS